jgi:MFS family permease
MITTSFIYPVFTIHLKNKFGVSLEVASILFIIPMLSYFWALIYLNRLTNYFGVKLTMCIGCSINIIAVLFLSPVTFFPQSLITIILGLIILGMTGAFITIPGIVDLMNTLKHKLEIEDSVSNDIASGIIFMFYYSYF